MFENLSKPEYQHILVNHFPIIGLAVAVVALLGAWLLGQRKATIFTLFLVAIMAGSAWLTFETGEAAQDRVQSMLYREGKAWLDYHEEMAEDWIWTYYLAASASLLGGIGLIIRPSWKNWVVPVAVILTAGSLWAGVVIAEAGGKIRHEEFRNGPPPNIHQSESNP